MVLHHWRREADESLSQFMELKFRNRDSQAFPGSALQDCHTDCLVLKADSSKKKNLLKISKSVRPNPNQSARSNYYEEVASIVSHFTPPQINVGLYLVCLVDFPLNSVELVLPNHHYAHVLNTLCSAYKNRIPHCLCLLSSSR